MELKVIDNSGKESGNVTFDEALVATKTSPALLHEVVVAYQAGLRSGTHSVKTRAMVSGGGLKPWKQKGTGNARAGSTRSPLWRKGGIIFGPVNRDYSQDLPKQKKQIAFKMALRGLLQDNRIQVVDPINLSEVKTKNVATVYSKWKAPTNSFLLVEKIDPAFDRASRNISHVQVTDVASFNTYDCLRARRVFITKAGLEKLVARVQGKTEKSNVN
ncbi:MAG: 50S ribosomal protein L4 [Elusimicrobia bacterium]|nr:50S ribosomal protein L4 [Elusimicrobiota bacterium]